MIKYNFEIKTIIAILLFAVLLKQPTCFAEANISMAYLEDTPESYLKISSMPDLKKADSAFYKWIREYNFDLDRAKLIFKNQQIYFAEGNESWRFSYLYWFPEMQKYIDFVGNVLSSDDDTIIVEGFFPTMYEPDEAIARMGNLLDRAMTTQKWEAKYGPFIIWDCSTKFHFYHTYSYLPFDLGFMGEFSDVIEDREWGEPELCPLSYEDAKEKVHQAVFEKYGFAVDQLETVIEDVRLFYQNTPDVYSWEFRYWIKVGLDDEVYWTMLCGFSTSFIQKPTGNPIPPFYTYEPVDTFTAFYSVNSASFDFLQQSH